ncbi:hypothetical protein FNV43_RR26284 [Rhamnella rubrinervis]|uniref:Remorin C-terminal domain-containing protein n=1 Tax=Rhamnella rubrinervis TaxID=2594499 RepID=A0A8K0DP10_9ROSA|nr:hypothetical protein FNV43_RR26284 [Rhamnella rubrinervis]
MFWRISIGLLTTFVSWRPSGVQQENKDEESGSVKDRSIPRQKRQSFKGESIKEEEADEEEEESSSVKDWSIPPQKSQSFKEKKKDQNWFWRQLSRQMSHDYSSDGKIEYAVAVLASAYAIDSLKESGNSNKKQTPQEPAGTSLIPIKSRKEDNGSKSLSFYLFGQDSKRSSENSDSKVPITASGDSKKPEKAIVPAPSMKKPSSFAPEKINLPASSAKKRPSFVDKQSSNTGTTKRGSAIPKLELPTGVKPPPPPSETNRQSSTSPGTVKSKADVWEESEIARINAGYEKQQKTILSWEQNQIKKVESQNHKTESDLDKKRKKVLETFTDEMGRIDEIVRKERANAEKKLKNDMLKAKENAGHVAKSYAGIPVLVYLLGRLSGVQQENKDQSIPPQKSQSFKEKKKGQNWFRRQYSSKMSHDYSSDGGIEHAAAVAASAYVIDSMEELGKQDKKRTREEPQGTSLIPIKSRKEDTGSKRFSFYFSGQDSKRSSENQDGKVPITAATDSKMPEKAVKRAPSFKRTPSSVPEKATVPAPPVKKTSSFSPEKANLPTTSSVKKPPSFADKQLNRTGSSKSGSTTPKQDLATTVKPSPPPPSETNRQSLTSPGTVKSKADAWEEKEVAKIRKRYEEQQIKIQAWESNMKAKAIRRKERKESDLANKRKKAMEKYKSDMKYIDEVAGGARSKAEEARRNRLLKAKEKANYIRETGKMPKTCFCF